MTDDIELMTDTAFHGHPFRTYQGDDAFVIVEVGGLFLVGAVCEEGIVLPVHMLVATTLEAAKLIVATLRGAEALAEDEKEEGWYASNN